MSRAPEAKIKRKRRCRLGAVAPPAAKIKRKGRCRLGAVALLAVTAAATLVSVQPAEAATVVRSLIAGSRLYPGIDAHPGFRMASPNGAAWLQVNFDGQVVLYENPSAPNPLWFTGTSMYPGSYLALQADDRNLTVIQPLPGGGLVNRWAAGIRGKGASYLEIQNDFNLVAYREKPGGRVAVWETNTWKRPTGQPAPAGKPAHPTSPTAYPSGGFPLRAEFYGGVQLSPSYEKNAVNACSSLGQGYLCRHVYGVDKVHQATYYLNQDGVKTFDNNRRYGWQLVTFAGGRYEGCAYVGSTKKYARTWICDYRTDWHSVYKVTGEGYAYLATFRDWGSVVASQGQCAAALGFWWTGTNIGKAGAVGLVRDCGTRPYNPR